MRGHSTFPRRMRDAPDARPLAFCRIRAAQPSLSRCRRRMPRGGAVSVESVPVAAERKPAVAGHSFTWHRNATFASLLVGYAAYYLCKANLSIAARPMQDLLGKTPQ